jgi:beta propeller repeat protein
MVVATTNLRGNGVKRTSLVRPTLITAFILIACIVIAAPIAIALSSTGATKISNPALNNYWLSVSGDHIVWEEYARGNSDIVVYTISNGESIRIPKADPDDSVYSSTVDGDNVVYFVGHTSTGTKDMYVYSISSKTSKIVAPGVGDARPELSGNNLVYNNFGLDDGIYYVDISSPAPTPVKISGAGLHCNRPSIYGNTVVYHATSKATANENIYVNNISGTAETMITDDSAHFFRPNIDGDGVVYVKRTNPFDKSGGPQTGQIIYRNLASGQTKALTAAGSSCYMPFVQGRLVLYGEGDWAQGGLAGTMANIDSGVITTVIDAQNPADAYVDLPSFDGIHAVWIDGFHAAPRNVYMETLVGGGITFDTLPGGTGVINLTDGQLITSNPYMLQVHPSSDAGIVEVEFYVDGQLIGTSTTPDANGVFSFAWDTSKYHSEVYATALDTLGGSASTVPVSVTVSLQLPFTGR